MFEQEELKNYAAETGSSAAHQNAPELFNHYEIKNWEFTPRIYKILAASAIFCVSSLLIVGQTNLLTVKGCDSPLVSSVCQVIDIVYIGGKMMTTDTTFVDKDYEKTSLGDVDITYIDANSESTPLVYPDGYFALANPEEYAARQEMLAAQNGQLPGIDSTAMFQMPMSGSISTAPSTGNGMDLLKTKQKLPPVRKGVIVGGIPDSPFDLGAVNTAPRKSPYPLNGKFGKQTAKNNPTITSKPPKPMPSATPQVSPTPPIDVADSKPVTEVELNKRPLNDLGKSVSDLVEKKQINLLAQFAVGAKGKLNKDGELDPKSFKYTQVTAGSKDEDKMMIEIVKQSIEAINKSGYLKYLAQLSGKDLNLLLQQDNTNLSGEVSSVLESDNRAKSVKSTLDLAISLVKAKKTGSDASQNDKDDLQLLNGATVTVEGSKLTIKFAFPKGVAQEMIQRKLLDQAKNPKPEAQAVNKDANVNQGK